MLQYWEIGRIVIFGENNTSCVALVNAIAGINTNEEFLWYNI